MRYKIHTAPILDAFREAEYCPVCHIKHTISERLVNQYLNEAVMEPLYRINANKSGFCHIHIKRMQDGDNKLGVSLQLATRADYIKENLIKPVKKNCKKEAERLIRNLSGCIICENTDSQLARYYKTIAMMYSGESGFPALISASRGFCIEHYSGLVMHADAAGAKTDEYLSVLYRLMCGVLRMTKHNLDSFADMFDHQRGGTPTPEVKDAINTAIRNIIKK